MINLAGKSKEESSERVRLELKAAGVELVETDPTNREVQSIWEGKIGNVKFVRAWTYYSVEGLFPLDFAEKVCEAFPKTIRATGHCGCPKPSECCRYINDEGQTYISLEEWKQFLTFVEKGYISEEKLHEVTTSMELCKPFIKDFDIDEQEALEFFVEELKKIQ